MIAGELCALVATLAGDRGRFTLEDATRGADGAWVAYLYDAATGRDYRVADYPAFRARLGRDGATLPARWAVSLSRPARNGGRDYSEEEAHIALAELGRILALDAADGADGAAGADSADAGVHLRALHVRYADDGDDRYRVVARTGAGADVELTTLAAYAAFRAPPRPVTAGLWPPGGEPTVTAGG